MRGVGYDITPTGNEKSHLNGLTGWGAVDKPIPAGDSFEFTLERRGRMLCVAVSRDISRRP